jgi:multidrug transporter EmrE-like cation transporter
MSGFLYLVAAFVTNAAANVLLKIGADRGVHLDWSLGIFKIITLHSFLISGVGLFALNVLLYIAALRAFPLSVAYPIMVGMSFLIANTCAALFLGEKITAIQLIGYLCILGGVILVVGATR